MSEQNKAVVRQLYDVMRSQDIDAIDALMVPGVAWSGMGEDREGVKDAVRGMLAAFPDVTVAIDDIIADGDKVVVRSSCSGTHVNDYAGIPATGKPFTNIEQIDIFRLEDGKVAEAWKVTDNYAFFQQLGLIPAG